MRVALGSSWLHGRRSRVLSQGVPMKSITAVALALGMLAAGLHAPAQAQATLKPDGRFRSAVGLGASWTSGNTSSRQLSFTADAVRATAADRTTLFGMANYARSEGVTTSDRIRLGGRHDVELRGPSFGFGLLEFERNKFANLELRGQLGVGLGWHVLKTPVTTWDLLAGVSYTDDRYFDPMLIDAQSRTSYGYGGLLLGEESTHRFNEMTSAKQRLTLMPNLKNSGEYRAQWDAGLAVSMSRALSLNVGLSMSYNSEPGPGRKTSDTLLTTGVSVRFD